MPSYITELPGSVFREVVTINFKSKKMKKIFNIIIFTFLANVANAQISIGKQNVTGNSTILDFNNIAGNTNGIILPAVNNLTNTLATIPSHNNGTFVFDKSDSKVKLYENGNWINLSDSGSSSQIASNITTESTSSQGAIMGAVTSNAKGILVLESNSKALILPHIATPHINLKSPYPGMMCYDTTSKSIAVFDGTLWNYWK